MVIMLTLAAGSSGGGLDPAVVVAIIGGIAAVVGAIIAFAGIMYGNRQQKKILRFQKELDAQEAAKQQEEQRKADTLEAARREMVLAQNNAERARAYRRALHADPRISRLQILDMSRPLEVTSVYVRVRVHEEARLRYEVDPQLSHAERERDPNAMLRASRAYMERRASAAIDPDEALRKYKRCAILGDPGAGKTTLLKFLTLKAADKQLADLPDLPIHIELNAFAANTEYQDLLDFAAYTWDERYAFLKADARAYVDKMLRDGKALLLLDALDETAIGEQAEVADASYQRVCDAILHVTTRYPDAPIVVTARKAGYQRHMALTGFTELEVVDFRQEDIEQFVSKWFTCTGDAQGESKVADLNARLRRNPRIQALAANPLLLSLIALVYEAQLDLPDRRADLYRRCVDVLLSEWDARRNIRRRREFKPEHKRQLLQELAWHFHRQGLRYFPERDVQAEIARFLPALGLPAEDYERVLLEIANENGLLKEQAHGWYGFLHLTLQEYFAALYINDHPQKLTVLLQQVGDPWLEEVLLLYAGQTADASQLLQTLIGSSVQTTQAVIEDDLFCTNLILAGRCLAARPTVRQGALREEVIARLFDLLKTTPYELTREQAALVLAEIGGQKVNEQLVGMLANERVDEYVRRSIAHALGALGERSVVPQLLGLLADERVNASVRWSIADALGALGERSVVPQLLGLLVNEQIEEPVPMRIAVALGVLGERSVVPQLLELLANEQVDLSKRQGIGDALAILVDNEKDVQFLANLLIGSSKDVADVIFRALWTASRRVGVRVLVRNDAGKERLEVVRR